MHLGTGLPARGIMTYWTLCFAMTWNASMQVQAPPDLHCMTALSQGSMQTDGLKCADLPCVG